MKEETGQKLHKELKLLRLLVENQLKEINPQAFDGYIQDRKDFNLEGGQAQ